MRRRNGRWPAGWGNRRSGSGRRGGRRRRQGSRGRRGPRIGQLRKEDEPRHHQRQDKEPSRHQANSWLLLIVSMSCTAAAMLPSETSSRADPSGMIPDPSTCLDARQRLLATKICYIPTVPSRRHSYTCGVSRSVRPRPPAHHTGPCPCRPVRGSHDKPAGKRRRGVRVRSVNGPLAAVLAGEAEPPGPGIALSRAMWWRRPARLPRAQRGGERHMGIEGWTSPAGRRRLLTRIDAAEDAAYARAARWRSPAFRPGPGRTAAPVHPDARCGRFPWNAAPGAFGSRMRPP